MRVSITLFRSQELLFNYQLISKESAEFRQFSEVGLLGLWSLLA